MTAASMLAVIGLLYTFGFVLAQRRALQAGADAAALAGTWQVLGELQTDSRTDSAVLSQVRQLALNNGFTAGALTAEYVDASGTALGTVGQVGTPFSASARGVRVTLTSTVQTVLPGFVRISEVLLNNVATAGLRPTDPPVSAALVVPLAVRLQDFQAAYAAHAQYDLFRPTTLPLSQPPTLNFLGAGTTAVSGASTYGSLPTNLQYWSDGQHINGTFGPNLAVALAGGQYFDSIATGLADNIRRQNPSGGGANGLILVPIWDSADAATNTLHIVGFAQLKINAGDLSSTTAKGLFVPFAVSGGIAATRLAGSDLGAVVVQIAS